MKKATPWLPEEIELLQKLRPACTLVQIAKAFKEAGFDRSRKALERKCANLGLEYTALVAAKAAPSLTEPTVEAPVTALDDLYNKTWASIRQLKVDYQEEVATKVRGLPKAKKLRKILSLSDAHIPFDRDDIIMEAVKEHADADILVVNGDWLDLHAVSTWPKDQHVVLRKEYDAAMEYMRIFSKTFPKVVITRGNHEFRLNRYFNDKISKSVSFLVNKEILGRIANGEVYDNAGNVAKKYDFSNVYFQPGQEAWFCKIGKTVFLHPQSFSKIDGRTSIMAWEYFMDRDDIDSVVVAHTHQQSLVYKRGRMCIEQGCLCVPLDYEKQGKLTFGPQTLGYCVVYQDEEGNTDFNKSHLVFKGIQYPTKPSFDQFIDANEANGDEPLVKLAPESDLSVLNQLKLTR